MLANIYLHHAFDKRMDKTHQQCPFERYADDIVIHCSSKEEAEKLLETLKVRMQDFELMLHPEKTKIVNCKNYQRPGRHEKESFTFLSYSSQQRTVKSKFGSAKRLLVFGAAICNNAKAGIRTAIKEVLQTRWSTLTLEWFAEKLNPKIRGWMNYYTRINRDEAHGVFYYLNELFRKWMKHKYKIGSKKRCIINTDCCNQKIPLLYYHWKIGIKA